MGDQLWDLVVVGAGPAGCAAAAAALRESPDAQVLLLDRHRFPRDKTCGDGIAAEALDLLGDLGFDVTAICDGFAPITRLRITAPGGAVADRGLHRPVRVIPRQVFDARLVSDVLARGAELRQHTVRRVEERADHVVVDGSVRARVVIGADGAESVLRGQLGRRAPARRWTALALRGYAPEIPGQDGAQLITMSTTNWPAYAWSFPIGAGRANVGYGELLVGRPLNRAQMTSRMRDLLPGLHEVADLRAHRLPLSPGRPRVGDGRLLLAGDALSLINPLSGEGIFYAIRSGALAGAAAVQGAAAVHGHARRGRSAGRTYRAGLADALGGHLRTTDLLNRMIRAPRMIDAGVAAAAAAQRPFDDLVRISLADGRFTRPLITGVARNLVRRGSRG